MIGKRAIHYISIFCLVCLAWGIVEARLLSRNEQIFSDSDLLGVFDGYRIAFITDIHAGPFFSLKRVDRLVDKINAAAPDLVILGGDYVFLGRKYIPGLAESLGNIQATTVAVMGNHDHWEAPEFIREEFAKQGIMMLDNGGFWIEAEDLHIEGNLADGARERIRIAGVDDWQTAGSFLDKALEETVESDLVALVSHNPDATYLLGNENRVDLVLSGHTHGGQVSFFGLFAPLVPIDHGQDYVSGWVEEVNFRLFVSRGVGTTMLPLRFFSRPQWHIFTLKQ